MSFKLIGQISINKHNFIKEDGSVIDKHAALADYCRLMSNTGVDGIFVKEVSDSDIEHDENIDTVKEIVTIADTDIFFYGNIKRLEDVKKYLYAGSRAAVLDLSKESNVQLIKEACDRFGKEKLAVLFDETADKSVVEEALNAEVAYVFAKNIKSYTTLAAKIPSLSDSKVIILGLINDCELIKEVYDISKNKCHGVGIVVSDKYDADYMSLKHELKAGDVPTDIPVSNIDFSSLKKNNDGMVPVIVQDYKTDEVLMLAYMNEEAFEHTIKTGRMTYYSRSRNELWEKGLTSGHYQYVKAIYADCDNDTLLAKVFQVGAACHTGKKSCFFNEVLNTNYTENNPHKILDNVFNVILDRKEHPKEGSYTNYLFDKGIDKILKKVGEEATEIIIAAKNTNPEEIKYEISDFLYHVMVLMAEKNVTWEDIMTELSRR